MKKAIKVILINILLIAFGVLIIEIIWGAWLKTSPLSSLRIAKNIDIIANAGQFYKRENPVIKYHLDKYGFRGDYNSPSDIDIITIGGSTTQQLYIPNGETWQDVIKSCLYDKGIKINIVNAGKGGQSTYGHIESFDAWLLKIPGLKPKFIIFYVGINDFYRFTDNEPEKHGWDKYEIEKKKGFLYSVRRKISTSSIILQLYRSIKNTYNAMIVEGINYTVINFTDVKWTNKALLDSYDFMESDLTNYSNRLRILADKTYDFGSFPIFISQPTRIYRLSPIGVVGRLETAKYHDYVYNGVDYYFMMKKLDSVTKSIANEKKALFIDLSSNTEWCDNDFYDWCHNTPQGCQKVGSHICKSIEHLLK